MANKFQNFRRRADQMNVNRKTKIDINLVLSNHVRSKTDVDLSDTVKSGVNLRNRSALAVNC